MSKVFKAVGDFVGGAVKAVVKAVSSVVKAVVNIASSVINFIAQPFMGLLGGMPDMPNAAAEADRQQGVLIQRTGSNVNIPVVYGYRKVGGIVTFAETGSTNNRYLYVAYVFSEGIVEGLREVYIDDYQLPSNIVASLNAGQLTNITTDRYKDRVQLQWFPGQYFPNANGSPVGGIIDGGIFKDAPSFQSNMAYNGLAVLFARYEWKEIKTQEEADSNPFGGNIPEVQVCLLGRRVASLLVDAENSTYATAGVRYSTNPAEILLDYLRNPRYGKGLTNDDIDWDSWKKAARKCNQTVTYTTGGGATGPILTCNYVVDTAQSIFANVKTLLMGFRAYMPYVQGKYRLRIEDAGNETDILSGAATIVATYTKDNIVGAINYTGIEKSAKYNVVSVSYVDPDQKFSVQNVIYPEAESERQSFITLDGGRENKLEATFPTLTNYAMAKDMARLLFNKSRRQETCSLTVSSQGLELEPGDNIRINSTILNFGTDPWRIVSIKINDNMTVDIGCVRNPDDIYPYVRAGEQDIVLPVYVPKGSTIYYPESNNQFLIGLVPPTYAVYPTNFTPVIYNPGATNPNGVGGGGVGGGSPTGGTAGPIGGTTPIPVPPVTVIPPPTPIPVAFAAALEITGSQILDYKNGTFGFNLQLKQPSDGTYKSATMWWRANIYSPWIEVSLTALPGPGKTIWAGIGPLPRGIFEFYIRAYASDGRGSTQVTNGFLASRADYLEQNPNFNGLVTSGVQTIGEGWTLPGGQLSTTPQYNADIDRLELRPKLSSGFPVNPRRIIVTVQQITDLLTKGINPLVSGITIYWREPGEAVFWNYYTFTFPASYTPGLVVTFEIPADFGGRAYPTAIIQGSATDILQTYEFFARLTYRDKGVPTRQLQVGRGKVEYSAGYDYIIWGTTFSGNETITSAFNQALKTVDQRPAGATPGMDIVASVNNISSDPNLNKITFKFNPVISSAFRGFKIRYREVIAGTNPTFIEIQTSAVAQGDVLFYTLETNYSHGRTYEWVITAQVNDAGVIKDATNSLTARAKIDYNDAQRDSLAAKFNFATRDTVSALAALRVAFPALPTANVQRWNKVVANPDIGDFQRLGISISTANYFLNKWYKLYFQVPSTSPGIVLYRRYYDTFGMQQDPNTTGYSKYWGIGPWERVVILKSSLSLVNGWYEANVRGPVFYSYFSPYYQVPGYIGSTWDSLVSPSYSSFWPNSQHPSRLLNVRPYQGAGDNPQNSTVYNQFLVVLLKADNTEETRGLLLRDFATQDFGSAWTREKEGFTVGGVANDNVITDLNATFNTPFIGGYGRRLTDAISPAPFNRLNTGDPQLPAQDNAGNYTRFLNPPQDGTTIY